MRRDVPTLLTGCLLLPLFAVPAEAYAASQSVVGIVLLSMLAVALHGFVRFTVNRGTEAGFVTGLALAAAFTVDLIAIFYALALGMATWFLTPERLPFATRATVAVIVFPTVCAVLSWMFLEWRFTGGVFGTLVANTDLFDGAFGTAATTVGASLLHVPLFVAVAVVFAVRRPLALVGYLTVVPASVVAVWIGLRYTPVTAYVLFTLVALLSVPRDAGRRTGAALGVVAVVQLVLAWVWPPTSPGFADWLAAVQVRPSPRWSR